jgi:hypothetical protein
MPGNVKLGDPRPLDELQVIGLAIQSSARLDDFGQYITTYDAMLSRRCRGRVERQPWRPVQARVRQARVGRSSPRRYLLRAALHQRQVESVWPFI